MNTFNYFLFNVIFVLTFSLSASAQSSGAEQHFNKDKSGLALAGYDVVSYFSKEGPKKGDNTFKYDYLGATYLFSSKENMVAFKSNPYRFAPRYGGWCAYAMAKNGSKVKVNPETFKIVNGMLHMFYNFGKTNTLTKWNEDEPNLSSKADEYWQEVIAKK